MGAGLCGGVVVFGRVRGQVAARRLGAAFAVGLGLLEVGLATLPRGAVAEPGMRLPMPALELLLYTVEEPSGIRSGSVRLRGAVAVAIGGVELCLVTA